jgi:uncharacterized protein
MINLRSKLAQAVLSFFMLNEDAEVYVNELARQLNLDSGNLARKLREFEQAGVLRSTERGRERFYSVNPDFPLRKEYKQIVLKTVGVEQTLREALLKISGVKQAFVFGSYASGKLDASSDIDLFVIGNQNSLTLQKEIAKIQKKIKREINIISMEEAEYRSRARTDYFVKSIEQGAKVVIL